LNNIYLFPFFSTLNLIIFLKLIEKLSVKKPSGQTKLKVLKDIAKEHQIDWDTTESEQELLKPPEELIVRPTRTLLQILLSYMPDVLSSYVFLCRKGRVHLLKLAICL
jgi:hypothetical protein